MDKPVVVLLGATGLFGSCLAKRLLEQGSFTCVLAGRTEAALKSFCRKNGGSYRVVDRADVARVQAILTELSPFAVVDCSGPFQAYGDDPWQFARMAVMAGSHYLDIADDGNFVVGLIELDQLARDHGVVALAGASTSPAVSSSVVERLSADLTRVISIETAILPGNRARRTYSTMYAILGQIGQPIQIRRYGQKTTVAGWGETVSYDLKVHGKREIKGRLASIVDTPDVSLLPAHFAADTVVARAGLELKLFHFALVIGRVICKSGLLRSLVPATRLLRWLASWTEGLGSDEGGMKVSVLGRRSDGSFVRRDWDLVADGGNGPQVPTVPVSILLDKIAAGSVATGARSCLAEVTLDEIENELAKFECMTQIHQMTARTVFQQVLGESFDALPDRVAQLHSGYGRSVYEGRASVKGARGISGWIIAKLFGFPGDLNDIPAKVTITADETTERWVRDFGGREFQSVLSVDRAGFAQERFGPLVFRLGLQLVDDKLYYPVISGRVFGFIPLPKFLLPKSIAHETTDDQGRFCFDVLLKSPFGARIAHYQGWLVSVKTP